MDNQQSQRVATLLGSLCRGSYHARIGGPVAAGAPGEAGAVQRVEVLPG